MNNRMVTTSITVSRARTVQLKINERIRPATENAQHAIKLGAWQLMSGNLEGPLDRECNEVEKE